MSQHFVYPDPQFTPRSRAAHALRQLGHALVRYRTSDDELDEIAAWAQQRSAAVAGASEPVSRPDDYFARRATDPRPPDGAELIAFGDRTFSGAANVFAAEVDMRRVGDAVRATVLFGPAFESAPGRTHGGAVCALADDVMGYLMIALGVAAYTAKLEVTYRAGVPIDTPLWFTATERERHERKLYCDLTVTPQAEPDTLFATAEGLFVIDAARRQA